MFGVEAPADSGCGDPAGEHFDLIGHPAKALLNDLAVQQVDEVGAADARAHEVNEHPSEVEQGVDDGAVAPGDLDPQVAAGVDAGCVERCGKQRRVLLDVGAEDEHVARLQARVVFECVGQHLAQDFDLAAWPMAGVDLNRHLVRVVTRDVEVRAGEFAAKGCGELLRAGR